MSQTLVSLLVHIVFSTKHREALITAEIEPSLYAYLGGIARTHQSRLLTAGGTANQVHLLISLSKTIALSELLEKIKAGSSKWIKTQGTQFRAFHWQDGYGAFSIGASQIPALKTYIGRQKEHHVKKTFEEELIELLTKYGIEYNDKYLWD